MTVVSLYGLIQPICLGNSGIRRKAQERYATSCAVGYSPQNMSSCARSLECSRTSTIFPPPTQIRPMPGCMRLIPSRSPANSMAIATQSPLVMPRYVPENWSMSNGCQIAPGDMRAPRVAWLPVCNALITLSSMSMSMLLSVCSCLVRF